MIKIQLDFARPELISQSYKLDQMRVELLDKSLFVSKRDFAPATIRWTEANETLLPVQELAYDEQMVKSIEDTAATVVVAFQNFVTGNFIALMVLGLSL